VPKKYACNRAILIFQVKVNVAGCRLDKVGYLSFKEDVIELRGCGKKLLYVLGQLGHGIDISRVDINEIWTHGGNPGS
jgi:hypothetical protein